MGVLFGLIINLIMAWILSKILNRKFFLVWLCVFVTMGAVVISFFAIVTIIEFGVINESMLCLIAAIMCWISSVTMWKG